MTTLPNVYLIELPQEVGTVKAKLTDFQLITPKIRQILSCSERIHSKQLTEIPELVTKKMHLNKK